MKHFTKDPSTGLHPNEEKFCRYLATGMNQSEAYRAAHSKDRVDRLSKDQIAVRASKMAGRQGIRERVRQLLDEAKISDLDNLGRAFTDLMRFIEKAEDKQNFTALAALMRLRLQLLGALKDNVSLKVEEGISDEELVKRLSEKNPALASVLAKTLGKPDAYAA